MANEKEEIHSKRLWKCVTCGYTAPPTEKGHHRVRAHVNFGHPKDKRDYHLIDAETGKVLARNVVEARNKGLLVAEDEVAEYVPESEVAPEEEPAELLSEEAEVVAQRVTEEKVAEEEKPKEITTPEITDGLMRYTITLPADAFTLFNIARGYGLEKDGKLFDEWVFDCITQRFAKDYKMQLVLAPLEEA